jgi:poly-beta-1,6-N-acetyl-D-glucosamine synthase
LLVVLLFWMSLALLVYTYIGYGLLAVLLLRLRGPYGAHKRAAAVDDLFEPEVTLVVAAYNERECILAKVQNSLALDYPPQKLRLLFVTDGSNDGTPELLRPYSALTVLHRPERGGKIGAVNRAMACVTSPIVIFSDANTLLNTRAVREIVKHYRDPKVGGVAGEKRVKVAVADSASGAGEGLYWRYESRLKRLDSDLYSVVGAAGELFSIRSELYEPLEADTLLDDFVISLRIAGRGYRIIYEPQAYALEAPSAGVAEEFKRKVRNCAGGFQAITRLRGLYDGRRHGLLTFQFVSHRVLRWAVAPFALAVLAASNLVLAYRGGGIYSWFLAGQLTFYLMALGGWLLEKRQLRLKFLFVPFYFTMMNVAAYLGLFRFASGRQPVLWEKATRRS